MNALMKFSSLEVLPSFGVSQPVIEHPISTLARHDTKGTLDFLRHVADQQISLERYRIDADVEKTRIKAHRDVAIAREVTAQTRVSSYSAIVAAAIQHSTPETLHRVRITEDRGGLFSSCVFRLTVEMD